MDNLVASANTLKSQLVSLISPIIYHNMNSLFLSIQKTTKNPVELFQGELKKFSSWSKTRVAKETKLLIEQSKCEYLDKLLFRILSDEAKILAFGKHISLDYPSLNEYTHRVYIELAKLLYSNPHLFYKKNLNSYDAHKNYTCVLSLIESSLYSAIRFFLPLEDILDYTLEINDNVDKESIGYNDLEEAYSNIEKNYNSDNSDYSSNAENEESNAENEESNEECNEESNEECNEESNEECNEESNESDGKNKGFKFW